MIERRRMLGMAVAGIAGVSIPGTLQAAGAESIEIGEWLESISKKKVRAFLDIRSFMPDGTPFRKASNLQRALIDAHGAKPEEVGIAFGAGSASIAHVLGPKVWAEYGVGRKVAGAAKTPEEAASLRTDPAKWSAIGGEGVAAMRASGIRVLACRNTMGHWAQDFAKETGENVEVVNAKLIAGLHPGVEPVPAMIAAAVLAQGRHLSYVAIG
ncbi:MAG: hypothetical protein KBF56_14010 [Gemmatimonadaceae bacterium]|jgi:hypothetical protein|nr:hypothetical protein [Gemmatimonadota bacterium]MBP9107872.1 hypothetical protein [Gemmatimonadaceae bacterium]